MIWDVVVIGGGPAGAAAARGLSAAGRRTLLVDASGSSGRSARPRLADAPGEQGRQGPGPRAPRRTVGESLPGAARPLLRTLGFLRIVEEGPHLPSHGVLSAWGSSTPVPVSDAVRDPHGPGWHLDRARFDADLRAAAESGAEIRTGRVLTVGRVRPKTTTSNESRWQIHWRESARSSRSGPGHEQEPGPVRGPERGPEREPGQGSGTQGPGEIEAHWIIDATGRAATVARSHSGGGATRTRDTDLVAVASWCRHRPDEPPRDRRTLIEATPDGWWYTAPLPAGERVVVIHTTAAAAGPLLHERQTWKDRLAETTWISSAVGDAAWIAGPAAFDASGARLDRFAGPGWIAIGDAALSFDPLSSRGLLNALSTGHAAAQAIDAALAGDPASLTAYGSRLETIRTAYRRDLRQAYRAQPCWPERPFWQAQARAAHPPDHLFP